MGRCFDRGHAGVVDIYDFHVMRVLFLITEIFYLTDDRAFLTIIVITRLLFASD